MICPPLKLFSSNVSTLVLKESSCIFKSIEASKIELAGYVIFNKHCLELYDFYGPVTLKNTYFRREINGLYTILCKIRMGVLIVDSVMKIGIYEEIMFWIETREYLKKICSRNKCDNK